jgi:hypothetical protein
MAKTNIWLAGLVGFALVTGSFSICAASSAETSPPVREINVTSDSAPGWLPTEELESEAKETLFRYLGAEDSGHFEQAYALMADSDRQLQSFSAFAANLAKFNQAAGPVKERNILKITWTKDPAQAPAPGVYVAIDLISRFANIDRGCGYVVLHKPPTGGSFEVVRDEGNYLNNDVAKLIAEKQSPAAVEQKWAELSANCPNYPREAPATDLTPIPEQPNSTIGYPNVAAALADLRNRPGVKISNPQGWTVIEDDAAQTFWSFSPPNDPSFPAVIKRELVQGPDGVSMNMEVLCEAAKAPCDNLVRQFKALNEAMPRSLQQHHP